MVKNYMTKTTIPTNWKEVRLGEILAAYRLGGNYNNTERKTSHPLIKMGNVQRGFFDVKKIEYIPEVGEIDPDDELKYGDLLFNTRNTMDLVGKVAIWRNELTRAYYNSNLLRLSFKQREVSSNFFMNYLLNTKKTARHLKRLSTGTTSVAAIYTRDILKLQLLLPPLLEQEKIVEVLETWDIYHEKLAEAIKLKKETKK